MDYCSDAVKIATTLQPGKKKLKRATKVSLESGTFVITVRPTPALAQAAARGSTFVACPLPNPKSHFRQCHAPLFLPPLRPLFLFWLAPAIGTP